MILEKLVLKNFKKFKGIEIDFDKGVNVILGPNEAGKSTIISGLIEVLYADPATKAVSFFQRVHPWQGSTDVYLELQFTSNSTKFRLTKDFKAREARLLNVDTGKEVSTYSEVQHAINKILGLPSRSVFESTAFVKQSDITRIVTSNDFVSALHKVVLSSGSEVNIQQVLENLEKEQRKLRVGMDRPAKNPGPIRLLEDEVKEKREEIDIKTIAWERIKASAQIEKEEGTKLHQIEAKIKELSVLLENNKTLKEAAKKLHKLDANIRDVVEKIRDISKLQESKKQFVKKASEFDIYKGLDWEEEAKNLITLDQRKKESIKEISKLEGLKGEAQVIEGLESTWMTRNNFILWIGTFLISGMIGFLAKNFVYFFICIFITFPTTLVIISITKTSKKKGARVKEQKQLAGLLRSHKTALKAVDDQLQKAYKRLKIVDISEFYTIKADFQVSCENLKSVEIKLEAIFGSKQLKDFEKLQVDLLAEKKEWEINVLTDRVNNSNLSSEEFYKKSRELENLKAEVKEIEKKYNMSAVRVEDSQVSLDEITVLKEQLERAQESKTYFDNKVKTNELIMNALTLATKSTAKSTNTMVSSEIEMHLSSLTKGRYTNARLNEKMEVEVFSDEKNDWLAPAENLSRGTVDQIYFLTRLAFLKILVNNNIVPILLDDPFVTFDEERRSELKEIIHEIGQNTQVILLTHSALYNGWGRLIKINNQSG